LGYASPRTSHAASRRRGGLLPGNKRHEAHRQDPPFLQRSVGALLDQPQVLDLARAADRDHHAAAGLELRHERGRYIRRGGGDDNGVERRFLRPALVAVTDLYFDVAVTEFFQTLRRRPSERFDYLHRIDARRNLGE